MQREELLADCNAAQVVEMMYNIVLARKPSEANVNEILIQLENGALNYERLFISLVLSSEFMDLLARDAAENHSLFLHNTRLKLIKYIIPRGEVILDIGGANGSLVDNGYPHKFRRLIVTDLPPQSRIEQLKKIDLQKKMQNTGREHIEVVFTSMTDLSMIEDESVDLVWAGQVVEHVTEEELVVALEEIKRVLTVGGNFCFDTPNALMTRLHSPDRLIHPEHKKEYTPTQIRQMMGHHFRIEKELGLVPMPISFKTKSFSYHEMILNNTFSENLDQSYCMYFHCIKDQE